ncbi:DNA mismatch endonuclease Vsr [Pontibacter sp. Tf4]|uniref:very short patch repair endonuclease n=1 Tax=Pontibacter sp. Tf4 TaxID=2761620 RepID=UPI001623E031|nr:very short patch repair endonuclease [Pontibacter sp. Tf4]MBB6611777.1 DNA mismatch endonuclease Vsr [Pontibacter sp. Tf4]
MADVHSKETRSYNMSRIKGKDTKPELMVRKFLHSKGYRYKLHDKTLPGKPDIVLPKHRTVIHVHGCFWHGHEHCRYYVIPKTRTEWWQQKINRNKELDEQNFQKLTQEGWKVLTIFECELKASSRDLTYDRILTFIHSGNTGN